MKVANSQVACLGSCKSSWRKKLSVSTQSQFRRNRTPASYAVTALLELGRSTCVWPIADSCRKSAIRHTQHVVENATLEASGIEETGDRPQHEFSLRPQTQALRPNVYHLIHLADERESLFDSSACRGSHLCPQIRIREQSLDIVGK